MSVSLRVTFLDDECRRFWLKGGSPDERFHTWCVRDDQLILKRYPSPSSTRLHIPLDRVRYYELVNTEETDAKPVTNHPEGQGDRAAAAGPRAVLLPDWPAARGSLWRGTAQHHAEAGEQVTISLQLPVDSAVAEAGPTSGEPSQPKPAHDPNLCIEGHCHCFCDACKAYYSHKHEPPS